MKRLALLWAMIALLAVWPPATPAGAAPLIASRVRQMPEPFIEITAPIAGEYLLIEHGAERDRIATYAHLFAGDVARFPILVWDNATLYHVQVTEYGERLRIWETARHAGAWRVSAGMVGN